ncbi:MAG: glycosyltransferase [Candidatus Parvarchaeota archaeon]|jgi:glycosyltransferase involved in cell wall biosynthesis|nr:glycosyltransferase [Candidatus Parvarchaeota archaeon]MCL5420407.1 glycosyltransferase [Candidatus Parvarchaeota archaeon]
MKKPVISIYATVFNNVKMVKRSIDSVINQFPDFRTKFEFVITDNYSNDGTFEILREYSKKYTNIKIIRQKCSRGKGRAIAFNNTLGKYVFYVDLDTVYLPTLRNIVYSYKKLKYKEMFPFGLMSRATMEYIGNWRDLNYSEDIEIAARAISKGVKIYSVPCVLGQNQVASNREKRYATGLKYNVRWLKNISSMIVGGG